MKLKDKVAVITGGGRGIGRAYALGFAKEGAKVVIAEIVLENAQAVAAEIEDEGGAAIAVKTDVSKEKDTREMARLAIEKFGGIDILVNNAAIYYGIGMKPFHVISEEEWDRMMAVNVKGGWMCTKAVVPQMQSQGSGKIINVASGTFFAGLPMMLHYVTSKGAAIAMTRALARELGAFGINVNCISPGFTMSEASKDMPGIPPGFTEQLVSMQCIKRPEQPNDLVGTAVFLASDKSDWITGQTLEVDGGFILW